MDFRILGPLEVRSGGRPLTLGGPKQRALLALLLLHAGETVASDRLIDELWGERVPAAARNNLQVRVSRLRRALECGEGGPRIATRPAGYVLELEPGELDLHRFESLCATGRDGLARGDPATAASALREGLRLWRGELLSDVAFEPFAQAAHHRLEELRLAALEDRIEADLLLGRHAELVGELEGLVRAHALRERLWRLLMLAFYRSGRQAEALEAYRRARNVLVLELGLEPSRGLRELESAVLRQDPALDFPAAAGAGIAVTEPRTRPAGPDDAGPLLVGRQPELEQLLHGLDDAGAGRGRVFLLSGEPGIGKSRLADELAAAAARRGTRVLVARCWEAGGAPAYWPWVQVLRSYIGRPDLQGLDRAFGRTASRLAHILPELRELLPGGAEPPRPESEGARFQSFDAVCAVLRRAAAERPLVVVLDDLHAADEPSLLLLRFAAVELEAEPVVIVGTYRDVDPTVGEKLSDTLADLARRPLTSLLRLEGLSEGDVGSLIQATTGVEPSGPLVAAVHRRTEGNPLFIGELLRLLGADERLDPGALEHTIPPGVHAVIERRLRRLSDGAISLLRLASVLGREFRPDLLAALSELPEKELFDVLDEAFEARLIGEAPGEIGRLRFSHALVREVLYADLSPARRAALHRRSGEVLEQTADAALEPDLVELAHHFALAGASCVDRAVHYAREAGEHAVKLLAYEEAARLFGVALRALEARGDEAERGELLLALGEAQARAGHGRAAKATFLRAAELVRATGTPEQLARAALGYGGRFVWARVGEDKRTVALLEDALRALPNEDAALRARVLARLAGALRDQRSRERTDSLSSEAVEMARRVADPATLAYALDGRFAAIMWPENPRERLAVAQELLQLAEATGDRERAVQARYYRAAMTLLELGEITAVEEELELLETITDDLRQPAQRWLVVVTRATLALFQGRFEEGERLMGEALARGRLAQSSDAVLSHRVQEFTLRWQQGALDDLRAMLERSIRDYPARPMFRCMLALLHAEEGREADARRELEELGADRFAPLPLTNEWLFSMGFLADVASGLADADHASTIHELLEPYADRNASTADYISTGSVSRSLGLTSATLSRWHESADHFQAALEMNGRMGAQPWVARTELEYARMLLIRDDPADRERAEDLLADCARTCRELGMEGVAREASALERASPSARRPRVEPR